MELTPLKPGERSVIQAYGDGGFRISNERFMGAVIVLGERVIDLDLGNFSAIDSSHFAPLLAAEEGIEILLIGCGESGEALDPECRALLKRAGIASEAMGTGAACRTFNLLQAEGRRVAALLLPVG
ncbi:MAG: Mth938-like domain-containing protein [Alphaproteobacteria bacterium]|nr:Mth938-like domain-containing protein [Alphaproteobacteria bacterium]